MASRDFWRTFDEVHDFTSISQRLFMWVEVMVKDTSKVGVVLKRVDSRQVCEAISSHRNDSLRLAKTVRAL